MRPTLACLTVLLPAAWAAGQSRQVPAPPQARPVVITGAAVHTVSGPTFEEGYVVFEGGVITAAGAGPAPEVAGAEVVAARGLHVYPGLIAADTNLGLTEIGSIPVTQDYSEPGDITPEVRAAVAINPDSDLIPVARSNGILTALLLPRGGLVGGRGAVIRLDGWTWEQMAIAPDAGLVINWPRTEPELRESRRRPAKPEKEQRQEIEKRLEQIERLFDDAAAYFKAADADPAQDRDLRYESMRDVIAGRAPVFVRASSQGQIESAVSFALRRGLRIVIVGGRDADRAAAMLRENDVPVIITGLHHLPNRRDEPYDEPMTLPARLYEAGVRFAIASGAGAAHERNLNHNAGTAVAYGLPPDAALRAVTSSAAEIVGIGPTHGTIEPGKAATLIVTTGDPLQITTDVAIAYIDGRRLDLGDRHKALFEKYLKKYR